MKPRAQGGLDVRLVEEEGAGVERTQSNKGACALRSQPQARLCRPRNAKRGRDFSGVGLEQHAGAGDHGEIFDIIGAKAVATGKGSETTGRGDNRPRRHRWMSRQWGQSPYSRQAGMISFQRVPGPKVAVRTAGRR